MKKIDAEKALNAIAEGLKFINREKAKFGNYEEKWLKEVITNNYLIILIYICIQF